MNRLYQKLAQVFFTSVLVMGMISIANAQSCNHRFDLSSLSAGIFRQNHLELNFPEAIVMPLAEMDLNLSAQSDYELLIWIKEAEYLGGGLSLSLSGTSSLVKLIDNESLSAGIYRIDFPYHPDYSHLQLHWDDNCSQGQIQLLFLGIQEKACTVFQLGNQVDAPSLWLNPDGPYGPAGSLQMPENASLAKQWRNLGSNSLLASQNDNLASPQLIRDTTYLNGQAYLQFDGTNDMMSVDWGSALPQSGFSQFVVFRTNTEYGTLIAQTDTPAYHSNLHQSETGFRFGHMIHRLNLNGQNTYAQSYFKIDDQKFHIGLVQVPDSSFRSLWLDGRYVGANPTYNHNDFLSHLLIGGQSNYGYFNGDIAEILFFENSLSTEAIEQIYSYLSLKYQIPLESQYRFAQGDTTIHEPAFSNKIGSIGVELSQFLHRTEGFSQYRDAKLIVSAKDMPDQSQLLWGSDAKEISLTGHVSPRLNNRLARTWKFWQANDRVDDVKLLLEGFPSGLRTMMMHPSDPNLPVDSLVQTYPLEALGDGKYSVSFQPGLNAYVSFSSEASPLLDVQWSGFDGEVDAPSVELFWSTLRERYVESFVLERSFDGLLYQPIAKFNGAYRSDTEQYYSYLDRDIARLSSNVIHYRLKVVDPNGNFVYSPRLELKLPVFRDLYFDLSVLPSNQLRIDYFHKKDSPLQGRLLGQNGQVLYSFAIAVGPSQSEVVLDLSHLTAGIYSLELFDEDLREIRRFLLLGN